MLNIITRDGKAAHDFCDVHNINYEKIRVIKKVSDLADIREEKYVIIPPLPLSYHWSIRPLLSINKMTNVTKYYNNKLNKF